MEIDITDLFQALAETNLMLFSASRAEMGEDAGSHTWANCMDRADPEEDGYIALLDDEDKLTALRDHCRSLGAWDDEDIAAWTKQVCEAIFIQLIVGDMREADLDPEDPDWEAYEKFCENQGGRLFGGPMSTDGRVYYYLGD